MYSHYFPIVLYHFHWNKTKKQYIIVHPPKNPRFSWFSSRLTWSRFDPLIEGHRAGGRRQCVWGHSPKLSQVSKGISWNTMEYHGISWHMMLQWIWLSLDFCRDSVSLNIGYGLMDQKTVVMDAHPLFLRYSRFWPKTICFHGCLRHCKAWKSTWERVSHIFRLFTHCILCPWAWNYNIG